VAECIQYKKILTTVTETVRPKLLKLNSESELEEQPQDKYKNKYKNKNTDSCFALVSYLQTTHLRNVDGGSY
jgi:hypothetical protein